MSSIHISHELFAFIVALCVQAPQPCFEMNDIVLVPMYPEVLGTPHAATDDVPSYTFEGVIIRPVHLGQEI